MTSFTAAVANIRTWRGIWRGNVFPAALASAPIVALARGFWRCARRTAGTSVRWAWWRPCPPSCTSFSLC
jgi:hypothetical protein